MHSLYSSCSKHAMDKHLTNSRQAVDKQWTSSGQAVVDMQWTSSGQAVVDMQWTSSGQAVVDKQWTSSGQAVVDMQWTSSGQAVVDKQWTSSGQAVVDMQWTRRDRQGTSSGQVGSPMHSCRGCTSRNSVCRTGNYMKVLSLSNQCYQVTHILHVHAAQPEMVALVGVSYFVLFCIQCLQSNHFIALLRAVEVNDLPLPHLPLQSGLCDTGSVLHHLQLCVHKRTSC